MRRHIIIGDIHGMLSELTQLIEQVSLTKEDVLVLVGDLVDKGPDSPGVVRYLRTLQEEGHTVLLTLGNHEHKHNRFRRKASIGEGHHIKGHTHIQAIVDALSPEDLDFLNQAELFHILPENRGVVLHGGVTPLQYRLYTIEEAERMERRYRDRAYSITFIRYVDRQGRFVRLGSETDTDTFWANVYDGRFGHIYFGHEAFQQAEKPVRFKHATALDLGCVYGNRLAAAILTDQGYEAVAIKTACGVPSGELQTPPAQEPASQD